VSITTTPTIPLLERSSLEATARAIVASGKGILAADESNGTMTKRLDALGIVSTPESRLRFRELLAGADDASAHISGMILYDETLRQTTADGTPFPVFLERLAIIPGIKVDTGAKPLAGADGETVTEGLARALRRAVPGG
jgi:fructose-bisphosphate aldolase, class I